MSYSRAEQETTIVWDEEQKTAHIYTSSPVGIRKLDRLAASYPEDYRCIWVEEGGKAKKYEVNCRFIRFGKPASEAQRTKGRQSWERRRQETQSAAI